jgi:hypothetical protein
MLAGRSTPRAAPVPVFAALLLCPGAAAAQGTTLVGGSGPTEVQFVAGGEEQLVISRYDPGVDDGTWTPVCMTPCSTIVGPGVYEFMAGDHRTFTVVADGGVQRWVVEDNWLGGIIAGAVLTGLGPLLPPVFMAFRGILLLFTFFGCVGNSDWCVFFNDGMVTALIVAGGIGGAMLVAGVPLWVSSYGRADRVAVTPGEVALVPRLSFSPGLFAYENRSGGHNLGLNLTLRF